VKKELKSGYNTAVAGRLAAFKNWLQAAWTGKSNLETVIGDYTDYIALFPRDDPESALSLSDYFEATSGAADEGTFKNYSSIMDAMG